MTANTPLEVMDEATLLKEAAKKGLECYNSFYVFFKTFWPEMSGDKFIDAPHIKFLCDTIQHHAMRVVRRELCMETLIINVPPGSSKSTIATIAFPMWIWLHGPNLTSTNVSYSARLSARHAKKARTITSSKKWHLLFDNLFILKYGKALEITAENQNAIENNFKGERFNTSVDGTITGMHADFIIKDDMQDPKQAKSDTMREHANEWDEETLTHRHKDASCFLDIIISQRLHENDLTGYTLNKQISTVLVSLPSEITNASSPMPASALALYDKNGILDPHRRPKPVLENLKNSSGSAAYTCQYLQVPFNLEEQALKPSMFELVPERDDIIFDLWIDGAFTEKTENDPTGIMVAGMKNNTLYVKQVYNVYKTLPSLLKFIVELAENRIFDPEHGRIFIEPKASGYSLAQYIEADTKYNFVLIGQNSSGEKNIVSQGKTARHNLIQPKAESGRIKLFKGDWNDDFLVQLCGFPRAAHDEQVDNLGYAVNHYYMNESTFVEDYALKRLEKNVPGSIPIQITSQIDKFIISADYKENDKGDVQLFDDPNYLYKYRYIVSLVLTADSERGDSTVALVFDRESNTVPCLYTTDNVMPKKAALRALEMASIYDNARLVVAVKREVGTTQNEENDLGHIAIDEIRKTHYDNLYSRLIQHNIRKKREREYGFRINRSTCREIYYHFKEMAEANKVTSIPLEVFNEAKLLERKKDTGEISTREGHQENAIMAYSIALKVSSEMRDEVKVKISDRW